MPKINKKVSFKNMTVSNKITLMYAGFFCMMFVILSGFMIINASFMYNKMSAQELNETIDKVEEYIKSGKEITKEKINELNPNKYVEIVVIKHNFDKLPPDRKNIFENDFKAPPFEHGDVHNDIKSEMRNGEKYFYFNRIVRVNGEEYTIQVFRPNNREQKILNIFIIIFIVVNAIGVFIAYLIGKFISKRLLKPVMNVTETAKSITINDLSQRIEVPLAKDEIQNLTITFNEMIERLEISVEKQKRFISDASHELRTPISVIQGYANLIARWGKNDTEVLNEAIDSIKSETEQMNRLVNGLLQLAREDNGSEEAFEKISVSEILEEVKKEAEVSFESTKFNFEIEKGISIKGNYALIKQLMWIFIENGVKYNKSENPIINVKLSLQKGIVYITIEDNGIGISDEDISFIFDRFYRGDKSRNKEISGTGLGLSIADSIIKKHNASIKTKSEMGKGTKFIIEFPYA